MALASQALLDAQLDLWQNTFAYVKSMGLKSAIDLRIAETIQHHGGGATLSQIATRAMVPPAKIPCLSRLMRVLTATGVFNAQQAPPGISSCEQLLYTLTPMSRLLVGSRNQVPITTLILQSTVVSSLFELGGWLRRELPEPCMFQLRNDHTFWELANTDPAFNALFNNGMNSDTELIMDIVVNEFGEVFHGADSLIDVAGGHGGAAHAIGKAFPHLKCSVLELGHVVADAPNYTNVQYIAGNMFETVPPASMIFLKSLSHQSISPSLSSPSWVVNGDQVGEIKVESMDGRLGADLLVGRG
ncbi:O-methyltransferase ZRP4-like isoform X2 [Panicum virgatum]|uniref:Uncharacterized protein n=1 Tax=Panicum virgatum TaxID=38727 RepID=A0A8T0PPP4_PANVG|nr:O-methyltransferase ZRP4-like isoform X2 [Panicum virgatum]KAG2562232.1 hypothetical protein PVAP13_8KG176000 [Panicum virgatum]